MSHSMMLQDWVTAQAPPAATTTITQNESGWLDVSGYQDAAFYVQVSGGSGAASTLALQSSPSKDEAFFTATATTTTNIARFVLVSTVTGVQTLQISRWATEANQPLAKYLRWQIALGSGASVTFRIWVTLNQAGY